MIGLFVLIGCVLLAAGLLLGARALEAATWRRELVAYRLGFPRGLKVEQLVGWLSSLPPSGRSGPLSTPPLGLEVVASSSGIEHHLVAYGPKAETLLAQLQAALPGVRVVELGAVPEETHDGGIELALSSRVVPLAVERVEASVSAVLAATMPLKAGEALTIQWLVRGAAVPRVARRKPSGAWLGKNVEMDSETLQAVRRKQAEPPLLAVGRVGVSAATTARRAELLSRLMAAYSVMDGPGVRLRAGWWPSSAVVRRLRKRAWPLLSPWTGINAREAAGLLGVPVGELELPGLELGGARQLPVLPGVLKRGVVIGQSDHPGTLGRDLRLATSDRLRHLHLIGPTGTGKSTLMANVVLQDLEAGRGLVVVDPKRDLVEAVLSRVPPSRDADVVVLDPTDTERPVGLNVLAGEGDSEAERELVAEHLLGVFQSLWKDSWGPRSDDILRAGLLTLCSTKAPDGSAFTLVELPELLTNAPFRRQVLAQPTVPEHVRGFWEWFAGATAWDRSAALAPVLNKVRAFTMRTPVRLLLGQSEGFDLGRVLTERKVVLVPLSAGELGRPAAELLGSLIVAAVWQTIRSRTRVAASAREPVFVYLDEFQDVLRLPVDLADLLAQARGLGAGLTLAHQHLGQLPKDVHAAVLATARSQAVFQVAADDARVLARGFSPSLLAEDLMGLDSFHFALKPVWQGRVIRPVTGYSLPLGEPSRAADLRAISRQAFGTERAVVEAGLRERLGARQPDVPLGRRRRKGSS